MKPTRAATMATPRFQSKTIAAKPKITRTKPRVGTAKKASRETRTLFLFLAPFALLLFLGLLLIGLRVGVEQLANEVATLEAQKIQLEEQNNRLLAQAEQLAGYARISRIAHERLGMISLAPRLIVVAPE
ncbi:cell division protein FtsL [candidate division KSB1 bacterium]|nr:cell division protein FtsL [candidate division KSB1 bacterium]